MHIGVCPAVFAFQLPIGAWAPVQIPIGHQGVPVAEAFYMPDTSNPYWGANKHQEKLREKFENHFFLVTDGNRIAITVLAGQTIRVLSGPRPDHRRMVDMLWDDRTLVVFTEDLERRGEEIQSHAK